MKNTELRNLSSDNYKARGNIKSFFLLNRDMNNNNNNNMMMMMMMCGLHDVDDVIMHVYAAILVKGALFVLRFAEPEG